MMNCWNKLCIFIKKGQLSLHQVIEVPLEVSIASFRSNHEYKIEYEYDFRILNQSCSHNRRSSPLLTNREGDSRNKICVTHYYLKHAH